MAPRMKIQHISLSHFRGVPGTLEIDFTNKQGESSSLVLVGDNGTGKSSIVDGIEFGLQATLCGSSNDMDTPSPLSLAASTPPAVAVTLSDGTKIVRSISVDRELLKWNFDRRAHRRFSFAPFVLRRADIQRFWDTPDIRKQALFFKYFKYSGDDPLKIEISDTEQIVNLDKHRTELKRTRRDLLEQLAEPLNIRSDDIPLDRGSFDEFVRTRVYGGISRKQRKKMEYRGMRVKVDQRLEIVTKAIHKVNTQIWEANGKISTLRKPSHSSDMKRSAAEGLKRIAECITDAFIQISPAASFVEAIELEMGELSEVSMRFAVHLTNGNKTTPQRLFSEANLDLLALLVFIGVCQESAERGQARLLILDDVLQSVDSSIRVRLMEYLLTELKDWQFIITVHDRMWREQLRVVAQRSGHKFTEHEILSWSFGQGPTLAVTKQSTQDQLINSIENGNPQSICSGAGYMLDALSNVLSSSLPISVERKRGDKYTLGDLWPGIHKVLKKTSIWKTSEDIDRLMHLRNLAGAHFNEWAQTLSREEAVEFGLAVLILNDDVHCSECNYTVQRVAKPGYSNGDTVGWQCRCGQCKIDKKLERQHRRPPKTQNPPTPERSEH